MINLAFPSDGLFFRRNKRRVAPSPDKDSNKDKGPSEVSAVVGGSTATGGPWTLCRDQQARPFWYTWWKGMPASSGENGLGQRLNNTTGQWIYLGATEIVQPPPPPIMYIPQAPQQHLTWVASPQGAFPQAVQAPWMGAVFVPVALPASPTRSAPQKSGEGGEGTKKERKTLWVKPSWERCYDDRGKSVWLHSTTGKLVHDDPYE